MERIKCAHEPCTCSVEPAEAYCSHLCKEEATQQDLSPSGCRCSHPECESR